MYFLIKFLVNTLSLLLVVRMVPGIHIADWPTALLASLGLGFVNAVIRPVVMVLTLPLNLLSLGLLTFVINAFMFYLVSAFVPGFRVDSFVFALFGSLLYSAISSVLSAIAAPSRLHFGGRHRRDDDSPSRPGRYRDAIDVEHRHED